jgi:hypothetical protein
MIQDWLPVLALGALGLFWWEGLKKRELAVQAARQVCTRAGVQLLDETVILKGMKPRRDDNQRLSLWREFRFEYSDTGDNRLPGTVVMLGNRILSVDLQAGVMPY